MTISLMPKYQVTIGEAWPRGHHHTSTTVTIDDVTYLLGKGSSDNWNLYRTPWGVAVITCNYHLGYLGIELLDPDWHERETVLVGCTGERWMDDTEEVIRARSVVFFDHTEPGQIGPKDTVDYADHTILQRTLEGIE